MWWSPAARSIERGFSGPTQSLSAASELGPNIQPLEAHPSPRVIGSGLLQAQYSQQFVREVIDEYLAIYEM